MKKKLIAVAVAGALGVPGVALAQASTVQIYGLVLLNYNYLDQGAGKVKTDLFNSHDANIGFKGEEALGGGKSAWFQCESTLDVTGSSAAVENSGAQLCGRNSAFGLKGGFGNVYVGNWDTPMKITMGAFRPFSTSGAFGMGALLWNEATSANNGPVGGRGPAGFTRRQANSWNYATPNISGFEARAQFSAANEATAQTTSSVATKSRMWGLSASYVNGPLGLGAGYEKHSNYNPGVQTVGSAAGQYSGGDDKAWTLGASYTLMGNLKLMALYADKKYEPLPGKDLTQKAWSVHIDWAIAGPHRIRAGYTKADDTKGSYVGNVNQFVGNNGGGATGGKLMAVQYAYALSKRTELNFGYAKVENDTNARYRLQTLGGANTGQDQNAWVIGAKHSF